MFLDFRYRRTSITRYVFTSWPGKNNNKNLKKKKLTFLSLLLNFFCRWAMLWQENITRNNSGPHPHLGKILALRLSSIKNAFFIILYNRVLWRRVFFKWRNSVLPKVFNILCFVCFDPNFIESVKSYLKVKCFLLGGKNFETASC